MLIKNEYKPQMLPKQPKGKKPVSTNGRIAFVLGGLALAFAALVGRGVYLQTTQHDFLKNQGDQRFVRTIALPASRGTITDRSDLWSLGVVAFEMVTGCQPFLGASVGELEDRFVRQFPGK